MPARQALRWQAFVRHEVGRIECLAAVIQTTRTSEQRCRQVTDSAVLARRSCVPEFQPARNDLLNDTCQRSLLPVSVGDMRFLSFWPVAERPWSMQGVNYPRQRDVIKTGDQMSSGIFSPNFSALRMTPTAMSSLAAKIAVGGAFRARNFSPQISPDPMELSPVITRASKI